MKVTIERPKNGVNLNKLISPREPKFWAGLEKAAQDALIPAELTIGYRPQLTLAQSSRTADYNADLASFGADRTID